MRFRAVRQAVAIGFFALALSLIFSDYLPAAELEYARGSTFRPHEYYYEEGIGEQSFIAKFSDGIKIKVDDERYLLFNRQFFEYKRYKFRIGELKFEKIRGDFKASNINIDAAKGDFVVLFAPAGLCVMVKHPTGGTGVRANMLFSVMKEVSYAAIYYLERNVKRLSPNDEAVVYVFRLKDEKRPAMTMAGPSRPVAQDDPNQSGKNSGPPATTFSYREESPKGAVVASYLPGEAGRNDFDFKKLFRYLLLPGLAVCGLAVSFYLLRRRVASKYQKRLDRKRSLQFVYQTASWLEKRLVFRSKYKFLCHQCFRVVFLRELDFDCPICHQHHSGQINQNIAKIVFERCDHCEETIRYIICPKCGQDIDLWRPYDEEEIRRKRYEP